MNSKQMKTKLIFNVYEHPTKLTRNLLSESVAAAPILIKVEMIPSVLQNINYITNINNKCHCC